MAFDREQLKRRAAELAAKGVFVGTSSWKYPGWRSMIYDESRYVTRGRFSESRFERECLAEYARTFKTVCVDAAYYRFPDLRQIQGLVSQAPEDFLFSFKVTDEITVKKFGNQPRFGPRAGKPNANFLDAGLFASAFVQPFEPFRRNVGLFILEFSKFHPGDYAHGRDFVADLDKFLGGAPRGWRYGVEIRNKHFLRPEYFDTLKRHGVAHIFNSWADMPPVGEQLALAGSLTNPEFAGARFLLKPGRSYQEAVDLFRPYDQIKEPCEEARTAAADLIRRALRKTAVRKLFLYVNNRLEGNALLTLTAMLDEAASPEGGD
ncbi:MAG: DUF72 domain-containing protein [Verrucomicrobiota bacterium]|jgi:uncharacterized protein YecE (DUF72 family)